MRIKQGFVLRDICGENIIVSEGLQNIDFSHIISLNESAATMWRAVVGRDFTLDDMVQALTSEYEVSDAQASHDAEAMLNQWVEIGLVEQ